jgi:hypothetical protein
MSVNLPVERSRLDKYPVEDGSTRQATTAPPGLKESSDRPYGPSREPSKIERIQSRLSGTAATGGTRTRDFGFLPIPKHRRYDPAMKPEECFPWTMKMNFVFAVCSVSLARQERLVAS